jgi:hypothetical protein
LGFLFCLDFILKNIFIGVCMLPLSAERRVSDFLNQYDLSAAHFCAITGPILSAPRLSQALNDIKTLDSQQAVAALETIAAIERLVKLAEPLPLSLRNPAIIRKLLSALDDGSLTMKVEITQEAWNAR